MKILNSQYKNYVNAALWSSGLLYIFFIMNFLGQIALARLLTPENFGVMVLALAIVEILKIIFGFSVSMAYIKAKDSDTLFGSALYLAFLGWLGMMLMSILLFFPLEYFYSTKIAIFVCIITFFSLLTSLSYVIEADMEKSLHFKKSSFIVGISSAIGMLFAISFAYYGFSEKSLLIREIIAPIVLFIISIYYSAKKIHFKHNVNEVKKMFSYTTKMLFSRGSEIMYLKAPMLLISFLFGSASLGLISQMIYLAQLPSVALGPIATKVSFVFYSHHQTETSHLRKGKNLISFFLLLLALPISLLFFFYSTELLQLLWGEKWVSGDKYLQQLAIFTLFFPLFNNLKTYAYSQDKNHLVTQSYILGSFILGCLILWLPAQYIGIAYTVSMSFLLLWIIFKLKMTYREKGNLYE